MQQQMCKTDALKKAFESKEGQQLSTREFREIEAAPDFEAFMTEVADSLEVTHWLTPNGVVAVH